MRPVFAGTGELTGTPSVAVVVDVMRAYTVAAGAFAQGAERIVLVESLDKALELRNRHPDWLAFQDGPPRPGFDLANSPAQLRALDVRGRTVVQKTTAGTVGALAVADAELVLCAAFVVAGPTARLLRERRPDEVTYVITGDDGQAEEDLECARYIAESAVRPGVDPGPFVERARTSRGAARLADGVRLGYRGVHPDDIELCLQVDTCPFAMVAAREDGHLVVRPVRMSPPR